MSCTLLHFHLVQLYHTARGTFSCDVMITITIQVPIDRLHYYWTLGLDSVHAVGVIIVAM